MKMLYKLRKRQNLWDMYTRKEEYSPSKLDRFERFCAEFSDCDPKKPEVSSFLLKNGLEITYPGDKDFCVCLTHDIDFLYYDALTNMKEAAGALKRLEIGQSAKRLKHIVDKKGNPIWNIDQTMDLEEEFHARSSFYFLALKKGDSDFAFDISDIKEELRGIKYRGWEVGLHGGHEAYDNLKTLKQEKKRLEAALGQKITGYRGHYMRFKVPQTWRVLEQAGFAYDTTFGYHDSLGFRNGMCHPFRPYDRGEERSIDILEIPLAVMDMTFLNYLRMDIEESWKMTKGVIDTVKKHNGVLTLLWHNTNMRDDMLDLYKKILRYCDNKNSWMTSCEKLCDWWKENRFLEDM